MKLIDDLWSKWSVWASLFLTTVWASLTAAWVLIDPVTQAEIMADLGMGGMSTNKLMAYFSLAAAVSTGVIGWLRVIKQAEPPRSGV